MMKMMLIRVRNSSTLDLRYVFINDRRMITQLLIGTWAWLGNESRGRWCSL